MKMPGRRGEPAPGPANASDDTTLFRKQVGDVRPVKAANRIEPFRAPPPAVPSKRIEDERAVLAELGKLALEADDIEIEEDRLFLRPGLPRDILRKLRRSHWVIQDDLDLHGLTADEAANRCSRFASARNCSAATRCSPTSSRARSMAAAARWWCCFRVPGLAQARLRSDHGTMRRHG